MAYKDEEIFAKIFSQLTGLQVTQNAWINSLYTTAKKYLDTGAVNASDPAIYDLVLTDTESPELQGFRDRFSAYLTVRNNAIARGVAPEFANIRDYIEAERDYAKEFSSRPGMADLGTIDNIKSLITNNVSIVEAAARLDNAIFAVSTADQALKEQLRTEFPGISDSDLARALVTGNTDSLEQKVRFASAGIKAEAATAGLAAPVTDTRDLARQGVTRDVAREAFGKMATEQTGIKEAQRKFGKSIGQEELEKEAFGIKASQKAKGLRSQARAEFAGQTGITTGTLSRKKSSSQL